MLVLDASAVVELLMATPVGFTIEEHAFSSGEPLAAPHLIDVAEAAKPAGFARVHGLTVCTRDEGAFRRAEVDVLNPRAG